MAEAEIKAEYGAGKYSISRKFAGRDTVQAEIADLNTEIAKLQEIYDAAPQTTEAELFAKNIILLKIKQRQVKINYLNNNFPDDIVVDAWCAAGPPARSLRRCVPG